LVAAIGAALTIGVMAGFLDLAVFAVQFHVLHRVGLSTLKISRHASWMIPVAGASVSIAAILALTLPAVLIAKWKTNNGGRPARWAWEWCGAVLGTFLVLGPILAIRGLHSGAGLFLAIATGYRLRTVVAPPTARWSRAVCWGGAIATVVLPAFGAWRWDSVNRAEARAWASAPIAPRAPNLLWIVLDTVRADHMSLHGYHRPTTPAIDAWSRRGITFDQARSAAPWTLPSHLTMLTGLWPHEHGGRVDRPYSGGAPTLAEHLAEQGYATAGFAANTGMCNACYGVGRGFDFYLDHPCNHEVGTAAALRNSAIGVRALRLARKLKVGPQDEFPFRKVLAAPEIADLGRSWLDRADARNEVADRRPTFLFLNFMDAHGPYIPPKNRPRQFWTGPDLMTKEVNPETGWYAMGLRDAARPADRPHAQRELDAITRRLVDVYDDCIAGLDAEVGRLLDDLKASGRLENTWVLITADHGEHFGEHGQFGHGTTLYDDLTHVPLVLIPPSGDDRSPRGRRVAAPVSHRDLPTTMTSLLLPDSTSPFPGRSLARHWASEAPVDPDPILSQQEWQELVGPDVRSDQIKTMDAVLAEGHTLILASGRPAELYRLADDPRQERNLIDDPASQAVLDRLRRTLDGLRAKP